METLYTGHIHGFPPPSNISFGTMGSTWGSQGGLVALGIVLGSSISLVGLAFSFITYSGFDKDPKTSKYEVFAKLPNVQLFGDYSVNGKILVLPIQGLGKCNITLDDMDIQIKFSPDVQVKNGKEYLQAKNFKLSFDVSNLFSDLRSLAGTTLLSLLASLFMGQLLFVIGVGGIQDPELCLSLSLALLFMKLAALCWLCCCCHHALSVFRLNTNLVPQPEPKMGRVLANYSLFSWGFPLLMLGVAAAFKYKEGEVRINGAQVIAEIVRDLNFSNNHCWLMEGSAYVWGFLGPAVVLLFVGFYLAANGANAIKVGAALQIDSRTRNKMVKKRGLQIGLFIRLLVLITIIVSLGAVASLSQLPELWAVYSLVQGVQGLVVALLVSCNCRVLKLYSAPRSNKSRRGNYQNLRDGEGGRYGVLSVTNPNYLETSQHPTQSFVRTAFNIDDTSTDSSLVKMSYAENNFVERTDSTLLSPVPDFLLANGDLANALPVDNLRKGPLPEVV